MVEDVAGASGIDTALGLWRRRKWLLIVSFTLAFCLAVSMVMALPALYRSSTTLLFGQDDITESLVKNSTSGELEVRLGIIRQTVLSRSQLQEVIDKFDLYGPLRSKAPPESVIQQLRRDIQIDQRASAKPEWGKDTTFAITIRYQGWDPELVASVANDLAARFKAENEKIRTGLAVRTTNFIQQQLIAAKEDFIVQEQRVNAFRNEHMGELPEQQQTNLVTLERLNSELRMNAEKQIQLLNQRDTVRFGGGAGEQTMAVAGLSDTQRLKHLSRELETQQSRYTDIYPGIIHLKREINTLTQAISAKGEVNGGGAVIRGSGPGTADVDQLLSGLRREEAKLHRAIAARMRRVEETPKVDQQLKQLAYDYDSTRDEYLSLLKKYQDAKLAQSLETEQDQQVKVVEVAIPPAFPAAPNRSRLLFIGLILSAGLAGLALFVAEQLDRSFHGIADIRRFTNIPVMASITTIRTVGDRVRGITRFWLLSMVVVTGLVLMTGAGYYAGKGAEQVVWAIST